LTEEHLEIGVDADYLVEGDDNAMGTTSLDNIQAVQHHLASLGFNATIHCATCVEDIGFCGLKFKWLDLGTHRVLTHYRDISKFFKFGFSGRRVEKSNDYLVAIGLGKIISLKE